MEFLLFQTVDEIGIGEGPVFFALQFVFQFGMLDAERGHMTVVHLILLVVRLDDLTSRVKHESIMLSSPIFRLVLQCKRLTVGAGNFGDDLLRRIGLEGIMNDEGYQQILEQLKVEHRDLDDAINALGVQPVVDQLQIARLKKKKLGLKDRIMRLEDQLLPDIIA